MTKRALKSRSSASLQTRVGRSRAVKTVRREKKALARVQTLMRQRAGQEQAAAGK